MTFTKDKKIRELNASVRKMKAENRREFNALNKKKKGRFSAVFLSLRNLFNNKK